MHPRSYHSDENQRFPILEVASATSTTAPTTSIQLEVLSYVQMRWPELGERAGILSNLLPCQSKTFLTSPPLMHLSKSFSPSRRPWILGWCGGGGYWQPLAFVCLRATTCAGIAAANRRQPTHPHCLGARAHKHQAEGYCGVAWRGGACCFPLVLTIPCSLSSLCPPAGVCGPTLCQPFLWGLGSHNSPL